MTYFKSVVLPATNTKLNDPLTWEDFVCFLGLIFLLGTSQQGSQRRDYWATDSPQMFSGAPFNLHQYVSTTTICAIHRSHWRSHCQAKTGIFEYFPSSLPSLKSMQDLRFVDGFPPRRIPLLNSNFDGSLQRNSWNSLSEFKGDQDRKLMPWFAQIVARKWCRCTLKLRPGRSGRKFQQYTLSMSARR